jgi:hypothetical protein
VVVVALEEVWVVAVVVIIIVFVVVVVVVAVETVGVVGPYHKETIWKLLIFLKCWKSANFITKVVKSYAFFSNQFLKSK